MTQQDAPPPPAGPPRWWQHGAGRAALVAALLLVVGAAIALSFWLDWAPAHPISPVLKPAAVAVAPRVFLLGKLKPSAAYAVDTSDGLVLIDTGLEPDASGVLQQLGELRLDVKRLRAILLTHAHGDHTLGAGHLRQMTGAKVHAGKGDCGPLRAGGPREAFFSTFYMPNAREAKVPVDVELVGDEVIELGDARITALAAPGHTPGSMCYLLERKGTRILFTGDVIQSLSKASAGALGTYAAYLPPLYRGNARDYLATLRKLRAMPAPDLVLPGHPGMDSPPQSPRLGEAGWQALLTGGVTEMERLLARFEADGENFLNGAPKQLRPGLYYLGDRGGAAVYAVQSARGLVLFDAPGGDGLGAFVRDRLGGLGGKDAVVAAVFLTSADKEASGGLAELVRAQKCAVVAPKEGLEAVRSRLPPGTNLLAAEDVAAKGADAPYPLPALRAVPLGGRGTAPLAYAFRWANKNVLVSGRLPVKPSIPSSQEVVRAVGGSGGSAAAYLRSLSKLSQELPEVWLPAQPVHGQNANLYDRDWEMILTQNRYYFSQ